MGFEAQDRQHSGDSPSPTELYDRSAGQLNRALHSCTDTPSPKANGERPLYSSKPTAGTQMTWSVDHKALWWQPATHIESVLNAPGADSTLDTKPDQYGIQLPTIHINEHKDGTVTAIEVIPGEESRRTWQLTVTEDGQGLEWKPLETDNSKR